MLKTNQYDYLFYNRHGEPITMKQWCIESSDKHAFRKETTVNGLRILTKWTGVDMPEYDWLANNHFSMSKWKPNITPRIFVSYVWNEDNEIVKSQRYVTIEAAYAGHFNLVTEMEQLDFGVYHLPITESEEIDG